MTNEILGECIEIKRLKEIIEKIAATDSVILISGETGTGKDLVSQLIHTKSRRSNKPFITVNCGSIPYDLAENELFGHIKGAFTDAIDDYSGRIAQAEGGTLYLDEISDLHIHIQAKLLRFLQFKVFQPVGSVAEVTKDVRLIASTSSNLQDMIHKGTFREDLFYRLNILPLNIPPLRERGEDVVLLAGYFIKKYNNKHKKNCSFDFVKLNKYLKSYNWPGNVRELENKIERMVIFSNDNVLDLSYLIEQDNVATKEETFLPLREAVTQFKKEYIMTALDLCGWNQTYTANVLEIQRTYLARLIKELEIIKL